MYSFLSITLTLFLLMDPLGNVPIFLSRLYQLDEKRQLKIIVREMLIALVVMAFFLFFGNFLLSLLSVSKASVQVAGGLILFLIALKMTFSSHEGKQTRPLQEEPFIVPLAVPLIAGPGVLAFIMLYSHQGISSLSTLLAIFIAWLCSSAILLTAPFFQRFLGKKGLEACEVLMGLIITLMSVEMFLTGIRTFMLA